MPEDALPVVAAPAEEPTADQKKIAAFAAPEKIEVEGFTFHPFAAMRKAMLEITGNEIMNSPVHIKAYCEANKLKVEDIKDDDYWQTLEKAVPEFVFHITALAFICISTPSKLAKVTRDKEQFRVAVFEWFGDLSDEQWQQLTVRGFQELVESNVGNDYTEKKEEPGKGGAPTIPNS